MENSKRKNLQGKKRVCPVCGKVHTFISKKGYCEKHYYQQLRYGRFLDNSPRSIYDPNEYRIDGNITYISVYNKQGVKLPQEIIIDTEDLNLISSYKIYLKTCKTSTRALYYGRCSIARNKKIDVHTIIMQGIKNVDHINGNTLDNRKSNLRPANMTIQNLNKISSKGIQIGINTRNGKCTTHGYAATMSYNYKRYISRYYKTEEEAMYYRYLLLQLLPFKTNYNLDFMSKLTQEQKDVINKDFENRFKDRVL